MRFAQTVLILGALPFAGVGIAFLAWPATWAAKIDLGVAGPTALADVRAVYGGMQLGCAYLLWRCAGRPERVRSGLVMMGVLYGSLAAARFVSYALAGLPSSLGLLLHGAELLAVALAGLAAWHLRRRGAAWGPRDARP